MKNHSVLLTIIFSLTTNIFPQVQFASHTIVGGEHSVDGTRSVYAVDVDGDGDMDVLSASVGDNKIAWYENLSPVGIINNDPSVVPAKLLLYNNYPNPFNPETIIEFDVTRNLPVTLKIYDLQGREVATLIDHEQLPAAHYKVTFNARGLSSGVYFYHIRMGDFHTVKKMVLSR